MSSRGIRNASRIKLWRNGTGAHVSLTLSIAMVALGQSADALAQEATPEVVAAARLETIWSELEDEVRLTRHDKESLRLMSEYREAKLGEGPRRGKHGAVTFSYGASPVRIICAPLRLCDVALEPGETVTGVHIGDAVRWNVHPAQTGSGNTRTMHALIKPHAVNLETNLVIYTDRRVYHLELLSRKRDHMPMVSFSYQEESRARWQSYLEKKRQEGQTVVAPLAHAANIEDLNFGYALRGDKPAWRPTQVFDDGKKTFIEMPKRLRVREAPVLILRDHSQDRLVNYRVKGRYYVVDRLFDRAVLIAGVGKRQQRVEVLRKEERRR